MAFKDSDLDLFQDVEDQDQEEMEYEPPAEVEEYQEEPSEPEEEEEEAPSEDVEGERKNEPPAEKDQSAQRPQSSPEETLLAGTYRGSHPVTIDEELVTAETYNLTATTAFIQGCATFSMAFSWGTKYLFTGGEDGYIRQYSFTDSVAGKQPLTIGQRPGFVDTVLNAGTLKGYWENEQPLGEGEYKFDAQGTYAPVLSPVYSLAAHSEALWVAAGLKSGGINIQSVRHSTGTIHAYLDLHKNTVSELTISGDERNLLSGSWDKTVAYWDLETGKPVRHYTNLSGQVSTIAWQPLGGPLCAPDDNKSMDSLFGDEDDEKNQESEEPEASKGDGSANTSGNGANVPGEKVNTGNSFLTSTINGVIEVWDTRTTERSLQLSGSTAPPWCIAAAWSPNGTNVWAGRRNSTVDEYDVRMSSQPLRTFKFPASSGSVTSLVCMPNGSQLLCSSNDNLRMYDLKAAENKRTPFVIVPSHHGVVTSRLVLDPSGRYLLTASGGRGWNDGPASDMVISYDVTI